ncbi:hypothetical protein HSBAA_30450 [Vreelandella sulfidaeris]|uniref:Uncharacterized protein n=1 Tax=Vreelandella sulfidaeris TaxID=115553 RepID=A0A455UB21_9GAMM|nr:hypothetical protein HSBAA_30450 [Halomonas sulfidaeris]
MQRQLTNEKAELASKVERLEGMEKVLAEKIAPQLGAAFMLLNKLNGHIEKWSEGSKGGVPYMPIEPGMAEAVKSLVEDLSNHIVVVDRESIAKAMAEILGHA